MSYGVSAALQTAVYQVLVDDATLQSVVGSQIYDALPSGPVPGIYVALGAETVRDASDMTCPGAVHEFRITVVTENAGFRKAKEAAAAVSDALLASSLSLQRGNLVSLSFLRGVAKREKDGLLRRIDLTFRARVEDI